MLEENPASASPMEQEAPVVQANWVVPTWNSYEEQLAQVTLEFQANVQALQQNVSEQKLVLARLQANFWGNGFSRGGDPTAFLNVILRCMLPDSDVELVNICARLCGATMTYMHDVPVDPDTLMRLLNICEVYLDGNGENAEPITQCVRTVLRISKAWREEAVRQGVAPIMVRALQEHGLTQIKVADNVGFAVTNVDVNVLGEAGLCKPLVDTLRHYTPLAKDSPDAWSVCDLMHTLLMRLDFDNDANRARLREAGAFDAIRAWRPRCD